MIRKSLCLLVLLMLVSQTALAGFSTIPDREVFSLGFNRLQTAIYRERPVNWKVLVEPAAMEGFDESAMQIVSAIFSSMEAEGILQCFKEGGYLQASVLSGGKEITGVGHLAQEERTGINLTGEWLSIAQNMQAEAAAMLELDDFGLSLLNFDYASIRAGDTPFLTEIYDQGMALWALASPYSQDSDRLSVPSGATSHGMTYEIETDGFRSIIQEWAQGLSRDQLSLGFAGTGLSVGISEEAFDGFVQKLLAWTNKVELSKPIKLNTTFGEGDVLRTAKGSGTLREESGRTGISYSYRCDLSSTRITRTYSIDFQPKEMDTIRLSATVRTSSNNKNSSGHIFELDAKGTYNGEDYRLKVDMEQTNRFVLNDANQLEEAITGKITASLKYAGEMVAEVDITRNAQTLSTTSLTTALQITDSYDVLITRGDSTLFAGVVTIGYDVEDGPGESPAVLADAVKLEEMDFMDIELLRETLSDTLTRAKQQLMQALPSAVTGSAY